jgi:hypothetical protein
LCHCTWWWPWRVKRWPATQTCFVPPIILTSLEGNFWRPSAYKACMQTCTFTCKANLPVSLVEIAFSLPQVLPCRCDMLWYYDILWGCLTSIPMPHLLETYSSSSCFFMSICILCNICIGYIYICIICIICISIIHLRCLLASMNCNSFQDEAADSKAPGKTKKWRKSELTVLFR